MINLIDLFIYSHVTIILFLIYHQLWKDFISNKEENDEESEAENEDEENYDVPEYMKDYLNALGSEDFGDKLLIDFTDKNNGNKGGLTLLTDKDISKLKPVQLHRYLMKFIISEIDYYSFKIDLPDKLHYKIKRETSDKEAMLKFIIKLKSFENAITEEQTKNTFESLMTSMMPMVSGLTESFDSFETKKGTQVEELTELEKEMSMIVK